MNDFKLIEKSIIKTYRKEIWAKFVKACKDYNLVCDNDKIMVCISGGKDSFLLAKLLEELAKHGDTKIDLKYVVMDPGYEKDALEKIRNNARNLNLDITIFQTDIFAVTKKIAKENPCYMCARMRRGYLYDKAMELGCNKIALGHHFDDVIETTLLSMLYGAEIKTMVPKVTSSNFKGLELIRPMFLIKEKDIINWAKYNGLEFINCACEFTKRKEHDLGKRLEVKRLIEQFRKVDPNIDHNIFKSMENVNLECILGYTYKDEKVNFDDLYARKEDNK
ncbi:MAG: tRNA 2-thiocytidine biosynthesis protein TtcA [Bacilli bacterium]|nr:tRNA 2-thiocytidine biosynthesis protein TtcA [Bacilli bacterium]